MRVKTSIETWISLDFETLLAYILLKTKLNQKCLLRKPSNYNQISLAQWKINFLKLQSLI